MKSKISLLKTIYIGQKYLNTLYLLTLLFLTLLASTIPLAIKYILDDLLLKFDSKYFMIYSIIIITILILTAALNYIGTLMHNRLINNSNIFLRKEILKKIGKLKILQLKEYKVGKLIQVIQNDVPVCQSIISISLFNIIVQVFSFVIVILFLAYLNTFMTLLLLCIIPLYIFSYIRLSKRAKIINSNYLVHRDKLVNSTQNIYNNFMMLKMSEKEFRYSDSYLNDTENIYSWFDKNGKLKGLISLLAESLKSIALIIILIYGSLAVVNQTMSIGSFVAYIMYSLSFFSPINQLLSILINLKSSIVSVERVANLLSLEEELNVEESNENIETGIIEIKNLILKVGNKQISENLNFKLTQGSFNIVSGVNGVGKSTFIYNLNRFYDIPEKKIFIDNIDINEYSINEIRNNVFILFQHTQYISDFVADHLRYPNEEEKSRGYISEFIKEKSERFNGKQYVSELSGGQKQLLLFLYGLSRFPKIFIIDEGFSNMDKYILEDCLAILRVLQLHTTIIIISHNNMNYTIKDNIIELAPDYEKSKQLAGINI